MNRSMLLTLVLCAVALAPAVALAQPSPKVLVATGRDDPAATQVVNPGTLICAGGQPSGALCSPGTQRIFFWNLVQTIGYTEITGTAAAMFRGKATIVTHCNLDASYFGHCWGTFEWPAPELNGKWEGSWTGVMDYAANANSLTGTAYGTGGQLEGLEMKFEKVYPGTRQGIVILKVQAR